MIAKLDDLGGDLAANGLFQLVIVEEGDMLRPRQPDHHAQPFGGGGVEQVAPRRRVGSDGVDAELRHLTEVGRDLLTGWELIALGVGRKRPVRHALDEEALVAGLEEFSVGDDARR
jgi:hypothetical protein